MSTACALLMSRRCADAEGDPPNVPDVDASDTDIGTLFDISDMSGLVLQQVPRAARLAARAVCKLWSAEVDALVYKWQQRLDSDLLVKCIPPTDYTAAGLSFCHPPTGSSLDILGENRQRPILASARFWHGGQRVKGACLLAVSSSCINGSVVNVEGATHVAWTVIEQQKLETHPTVHVDGCPQIPGDAPQARWHAYLDFWPAPDLPNQALVLRPAGQARRANTAELGCRRMIRITPHGLEWVATDPDR